MSKSAASSPEGGPKPKLTQSAEVLEFPIDKEFLSLPPKVDLQAMLQRIEEAMPFQSTLPGERERRATLMVDVEFVL